MRKKRKREEVVKRDEYDDGAEAGDDDKDEDIVITQQKSKKKRTIILEIDPNKIVAQTAITSDRLGLSARQTSMMLVAVVKAGGGDLSQIPLSKSVLHVQRKKARCTKRE